MPDIRRVIRVGVAVLMLVAFLDTGGVIAQGHAVQIGEWRLATSSGVGATGTSRVEIFVARTATNVLVTITKTKGPDVPITLTVVPASNFAGQIIEVGVNSRSFLLPAITEIYMAKGPATEMAGTYQISVF